jgi:hypothetical protein
MKSIGTILGALCVVAVSACGLGGDGGPDGSGSGSVVQLTEDVTADCDVVVKKVIHIKSAVTVQPGTKVCADANAGLQVAETGSLHAVGTDTQRILFTGNSPTPGFWRGISFESNNVANALEFADVSYAGGNDSFCCNYFLGSEDVKAAVLVWGGRLSMKSSVVSQSGKYGLFVGETGTLGGFTANRFEHNALSPVTIFMNHIGSLDTATVYSGGENPNGKNFIRVLNGQPLITAQTFKKLDVPYGLGEGSAGSVFSLKANVTLEAGTRLEFEANSGFLVEAEGRLTSNGTASNRVTLTGRSATPGFWKGVAFLSIGNALTHTDVDYGGNNSSFCCGFFESSGPDTKANLVIGDYHTSASVTLTNVNARNSANRGVSRLMGTVTQSGTNDLTTGNAQANLM